MKRTIVCSKCNFNNFYGTKYCQNCGNRLAYRKRFSQILASLNFSGLAGTGQKDISIAPLFTANLLNSKKFRVKNTQVPAIRKKDGSWYCPDCGYKTKKKNSFAKTAAAIFNALAPTASTKSFCTAFFKSDISPPY